jgi:hypothetical protein
VESYFPSQFPYERIIISGKGNISTEVIKTWGSKNVSILLTDTYGNISSSINPLMSSLVASRHRMTQYDTFRDGIKVNYLQKQILKAKIFTQIKFLESLPKDSCKVISSLQKTMLQIPHTATQKMTTLEASGNDCYFLQNGFYRINDSWKNRGIGKYKGKEIEHLDTIQRDDNLFLIYEELRVGRLISSIVSKNLQNIGKFKIYEKQINLNVDRKRMWMGN